MSLVGNHQQIYKNWFADLTVAAAQAGKAAPSRFAFVGNSRAILARFRKELVRIGGASYAVKPVGAHQRVLHAVAKKIDAVVIATRP